MTKPAVTARRNRQRIADLLHQLDDNTIDELVRRGTHLPIPDGWATTTMSDGTPPGNSPYTGVEAAVDQRAFPGTPGVRHAPPDTTGDAIRQLFDALTAMAKLADTSATKLGYIRHVQTSTRGRTTTTAGACTCCHRDVAGTPIDRLRAGYCEACFSAWRRWTGNHEPNRPTFERARRAQLDQQPPTPASTSIDTTPDTLTDEIATVSADTAAVSIQRRNGQLRKASR